MDSFGKRLKQKRESAGYTQDHLAQLLGKAGKQVVSQWERDVTEPSIQDVKKLAHALGTTVSHLIEGEAEGEANAPQGDYTLVKTDELLELKDKLIKYQEKEISELQKQNENLKNIEVVRTDT
ncbi:helix-turn-helix domain-containing protein [Runella zeae]|uniref:helix-turn-helix domain-containing protein n=1 Tax=Runella zeae TaxID=94255 RepID=UPI00235702E7|nr:helix-turn-helix domain-containing protein [Runella zeae]